MSLKLQGIRLGPDLRALVDAAGPLNLAARALIILGAAAVGQSVGYLEPTICTLIGSGDLSPATTAALRRLLRGGDSTGAITLEELLDEPLPGPVAWTSPEELEAVLSDDLVTVGMEV
jgi:hypothetical protein